MTQRRLTDPLYIYADPMKGAAQGPAAPILGAAEAQTGAEFPLPEYSGLRGALALCKRVCLVTELDKRFERCNHVPPVGSIVAVQDTEREGIGYRLGVVVSDKAAFVSPSGLVFVKLRPETDLYWTVT